MFKGSLGWTKGSKGGTIGSRESKCGPRRSKLSPRESQEIRRQYLIGSCMSKIDLSRTH